MTSKNLETKPVALTGALIWIDRYAAAVSDQLPNKKRGDIEMEVRSLLLDEIDQVAPAGGASETQVLEVLRRYPSPQEMAKRYGAPQALIGPRYYQSYLTVVTLVVTIVLIISVIGVITSAFTGATGFSLVDMLGSIFTSLWAAFGSVTLIFALVERYGAPIEDEIPQEGWNPAALPRPDERNQVKVGEMIGEIFWSLVMVLFLTLYIADDGSIAVFFGEWGTLQVFSPLFVSFIPWLALFWGIELLVSIVVLARRHWTTATRLVAVAADAAAVAVMTWMLNAGELGGSATFEPWVRGFLVVAILVSLYEIGVHLWAIFKTGARGQSVLRAGA